MFRRIVSVFLAVFFLVFAVPNRSPAQVTTANVVGTVVDPEQALVTNAKVTIVSMETHEMRTAQTSSDGNYVFSSLQPGHYQIHVEAPGFKVFAAENITLTAGDHLRVDAGMVLGNQTESVNVNAQASALQTDTSSINDTVTAEATQNLPLNGRNFINLIQLTAGANEGPPDAKSNGQRPDDRRATAAVSVNGQSTSFNDELIDGMDNNERMIATVGVRPSIDSIAEIRVQTNLYTAEATRTAGGVINIITKAGTNQFHGSIYEFLRNDAFDSNDYFTKSNGNRKPEYRQNQFGGSLGGPIRRDKLFVFGDYEGSRVIQGVPQVSSVPTAFEEANPGNLSDIGGPVLDQTQINQTALSYFKLYPTPNAQGTFNNFVSSPKRTQTSNTFDVRVDGHINANNLVFGRYTYNDVDTVTPPPLPAVGSILPGGNVSAFAGPADQLAQQYAFDYLHIFNPRLLTELKAAYTRMNFASYPLNYGTNLNQQSQFYIPNANINPESTSLSAMYFSGVYASLGDTSYLPLHYLENDFQYSGSVNYSLGAHNINVGAIVIRRQALDLQSSYPAGYWTFQNTAPTGFAMANFLLGEPYTVQRGNELSAPQYFTWEPGVYVQDDWRATRSLTVNLGLRYDFFTPFTERHDRQSNFDLATGKFLVAGQNGVSSTAGISTDFRNLAPRIGFAETLAKGTVIRGGFGISYFPQNYGGNAALKNAPFTFTFGPCGTSTPCPQGYGTLAEGLPLITATDPSNPTGTVVSNPLYFQAGYLEQFNVELQRELGAYTFTAGYVGELGRHMVQAIPNENVPAPSPAANPITRAPYYAEDPNVKTVTALQWAGTSNYNAFEAVVQRRFAGGLTLDANYTLAHNIDDFTKPENSGVDGFGLVPSQVSTYDRSNSDLDVKNRVAVSANYELPFGKNTSGYKRELIAGWKLNGIGVWETGLPFTILDSKPQVNLPNVGSDRPDEIAPQQLKNPSIHEWFNVAAYTPQPFGTLGNVGRNTVFGPPFRHLDVSVFKEFAITGDWRLQFRAESFDLTNTPNFANPSSTISQFGANHLATQSGGFGTISSYRDPDNAARQLQFALRILF